MADEEKGNSPERYNKPSSDSRGLYVENLHYNPNSLTELRKIAEENPQLAEKIVDDQTKVARWHHLSEYVGMIIAGIVAVSLVAGFTFFVVNLGWWHSLAFIAVILAAALLARVLLTGEWSETSWFGSLLRSKGAPPSNNASPEDPKT